MADSFRAKEQEKPPVVTRRTPEKPLVVADSVNAVRFPVTEPGAKTVPVVEKPQPKQGAPVS